MLSQDDLAWDLVEAARTSLDIPTINRVSITIAGGDYAAVIAILLGAAADAALPLPADVCARLEEWVGGYSENPSAANLVNLVARTTRIRAQD